MKWFLPRADPHISLNSIYRHGCQFRYQYREGLYELYESLDEFIEKFVFDNYGDSITILSQNKIFGFNFPTDFLSCDEMYWFDGDHLSAHGEERFGARLPDDFLEK